MEKVLLTGGKGEISNLFAMSGKGFSHLDKTKEDIDEEKSIKDVISEVAEEEGITYEQALQMFQKGLKMMHGHNMNTNPKKKARSKAKRKASRQSRKRNRK